MQTTRKGKLLVFPEASTTAVPNEDAWVETLAPVVETQASRKYITEAGEDGPVNATRIPSVDALVTLTPMIST
jgi:predicted amidohydrolase